MPRGKRATGESGARGRFNKNTGNYRIGGLEVAFDPELQVDVDTKAQPTPLFPKYNPPAPTPLTAKELTEIARFRALRSAIHEGPYHSVLGDDVRVGKGSKNVDPFQGVPTYSQKYMRQRRTLPRFKDRPHVLKFFPRELWSTIDKGYEIKNEPALDVEAKKARMAKWRMSEAASSVDGKRAAGGEGTEDNVKKEVGDAEDDAMEDAVVDDAFEEDDDEGGDYNAEGYFDDGGDEAGDFGGDDGDGGGDFF